eukprot:gene3905-biopygen12293
MTIAVHSKGGGYQHRRDAHGMLDGRGGVGKLCGANPHLEWAMDSYGYPIVLVPSHGIGIEGKKINGMEGT